MAKLIKSILANRMMFRGGGLVAPNQAAGILASSAPLIDSVTMNEGGPVNFQTGGFAAGAPPHDLDTIPVPQPIEGGGYSGTWGFPNATGWGIEDLTQRRLSNLIPGKSDYLIRKRKGQWEARRNIAMEKLQASVEELVRQGFDQQEAFRISVNNLSPDERTLVGQEAVPDPNVVTTPIEPDEVIPRNVLPPGTKLSDFKERVPAAGEGIASTDEGNTVIDALKGTVREAWRQGQDRQEALWSGDVLPEGPLKDTLTQTTLGDVVDYWTSSNNADEGIVTAQEPSFEDDSLTVSEMLEDIQRYSPKSDMTSSEQVIDEIPPEHKESLDQQFKKMLSPEPDMSGGPDSSMAGGMGTSPDFSMDDTPEDEAETLSPKETDVATARFTDPSADPGSLQIHRAQTFIPPNEAEAKTVVKAKTEGGPDSGNILANAPFTEGDAELELLKSILGQGMSPAENVDEKSLREEIDALLPSIKEDPTGKALQYFLLAAQVADKGVAEGLRDGLPAMIKYKGERQKEIRQREQDVASLVLKEKLDVRSEKRALNAARQGKLWEYQFEEMKDGLKVSPYMVLKDTVVDLKTLGYTDEQIAELGVDKLTLRAGDTPPGLSRNKADALKDLGVSLAPVEDVDIDFSDILKGNAPAKHEISESFKRAVGVIQKALPSEPYLLFGDKLDNNAFSVDVISPDVILANDSQVLKQLLAAGFGDSVQKMLSGDSIVSPTALREAQQEYTKRFTALNSLQKELVALDKLAGTGGLTGAQAAIENVGEWAQGLGFAWSKEIGDILLADAFKETGENVSIDTQYAIKSHMFLARAAKLLLGEEGKTISNQDRTRIAQAIGLDLELSKDGDVVSVKTTGFKRLLKNPHGVRFALKETGNLLSNLATGLNNTYRNFLTDIAGVETKSQELQKSAFMERDIRDPEKRAAFLSSLSPDGRNYIEDLGKAFSLDQAIDIGELMKKEEEGFLGTVTSIFGGGE